MASTRREDIVNVKFVGEPPTHVFSDQYFDIVLALEVPDSYRRDSRTTAVVELEAELYQSVNKRASPTPVSQSDLVSLTVDPSIISLPVGGGESGKLHSTTARCRVRSPVHDTAPTTYQIRLIEKRPSDTPFIVRPAISRSIQMVNAKLKIDLGDWEETFYKDEGGRDRCMSVNVGLYDERDQPLRNRRLSLDLTLLYSPSLSPVMKKDIFRVIGPTEKSALDDNGKTKLDFRIDDVSKNHTGQSFVVKISAKEPNDDIVAPTETPPVSVRSKRTTKRPRTQNRPPQSIPSVPQQISHQPRGPMYSQHQSAHRLRQAMQGILTWTDHVVNGLPPLKWELLGYNDGDYSKPLYKMENPTNRINEIMNMYGSETREHLKVLLATVEETTQDPYRPPHDVHPSPSSRPHNIHEGRPVQISGMLPDYSTHFGTSYAGGAIHHQQMTPHLPGQEPPPHIHEPHRYPNVPQMLTPTPDDISHPLSSMAPPYHHQEDLEQEQQIEEDLENENKQADVHFVLAKQYQSKHNNRFYGCPAYSITKELLGFYVQSRITNRSGRFLPISNFDFGTTELSQARGIVLQAIENNSGSLYRKRDGGSLTNLVAAALKHCGEMGTPSQFDYHV